MRKQLLGGLGRRPMDAHTAAQERRHNKRREDEARRIAKLEADDLVVKAGPLSSALVRKKKGGP